MGASLEILVVDDEQEIAALLADVLREAGYKVRKAVDGRSALAAVQEHPPALIILDNMMPCLSGRDVVRSLRADEFKHLPIIMMSAATSAEQLLKAGATDFISKPFDLDDLLDCIAHHLERSTSQRAKLVGKTS